MGRVGIPHGGYDLVWPGQYSGVLSLKRLRRDLKDEMGGAAK